MPTTIMDVFGHVRSRFQNQQYDVNDAIAHYVGQC